MLKDLKENLILLVFALLLREYLTLTTICFVVLGTLLVWFRQRPSRIVRNLLALGIFGSYWVTYGKVIDPEVGLNFLTTVIVLKILEKDSVRDRYMIFYGLLLIISAGSLFERSLGYVFFFALSFLALIYDFYQGLGLRWKARDLGLAFLWIFPLTFALFFFVPRMMSPIPFQQGQTGPGEVGYTPNVSISDVESLTGNDNPVFEALVSMRVPQENLYWRGNTLSFTDGWNWTNLAQEQSHRVSGPLPETPDLIHQSIRNITREDYFFFLESPVSLKAAGSFFSLTGLRSRQQRRNQWVQRYEVSSTLTPAKDEETGNLRRYLSSPLSREEKDWIRSTFTAGTLPELERELRKYISKEGFSYSLTPGKVAGFSEFMKQKKSGFCSHYASALALILRAKDIPSRLVSGFMGGTYNPYAGFYLVTQNDAHVWVEAYANGAWTRVDPTGWIAPSRVTLGGEQFMFESQAGVLKNLRSSAWFGFIYDFRMWIGQWDFRFYQWLERMDYYGQEAWFAKFRLKRGWIMALIPLILLVFSGLYFLSLWRRKDPKNPYEQLWELFEKKLAAKGLTLPVSSLHDGKKALENFEHPDREKMLQTFEQLIHFSFAGLSDYASVRTQIKKL